MFWPSLLHTQRRCPNSRTWFVFLFGRNLRICCFNFLNVCTSAVSWSWNFSPNITLRRFLHCPEDAKHDFRLRSLQFEFVLPHPPYSPHLAPSDCQLFGHLKYALRRCIFSEDDELEHSVRPELRRFSIEFYPTSIQRLTHQREKCFVDEGDFVGK